MSEENSNQKIAAAAIGADTRDIFAKDVTTIVLSEATLALLDTATKFVNKQRGSLGAISNRLDSTVSNLTNISNNLAAGKGRIEDADLAAETTTLAKTQVLQ